jgi:hypothetical protein
MKSTNFALVAAVGVFRVTWIAHTEGADFGSFRIHFAT